MVNQQPSFNSSRSDPQAIWQRARELLRDALALDVYDTWFADTGAVEVRGGVLHLSTTSSIKAQTLRGSYALQIDAAVRQAAGRAMAVEWRIAQRAEPSAPALSLPESDGCSLPIQTARSRPVLNPNYTFESFVEGPSNQIALAAAQRVAFYPGEGNSPLLIYSHSGLGKTHLAHAIAQVTMAKRYTMVVDCEIYIRQFVQAVRDGERAKFQEKYESAEVLIIDDVQGLGTRMQTQEELFNAFNVLHQRGSQIVLTADQPPARLPGMNERLVTRFAGGLVAEISPPDLELRLAILQRQARVERIGISEAALMVIAERGGDDVRTLLGSLFTAQISAGGGLVTPEIASRALANRATKEAHRPKPTIPVLIREVSDITGIGPDQIRSTRKDRRTARARQLIMYLASQHTEHSLSEIGEQLGGRDHSTVLHGRNKVQQLVDRAEAASRSGDSDAEAQSWVQQIAEVRGRLFL